MVFLIICCCLINLLAKNDKLFKLTAWEAQTAIFRSSASLYNRTVLIKIVWFAVLSFYAEYCVKRRAVA